MRVLLNHSKAKSLHKNYPDFVGVLFSPERTRFYPGVPFAIDNGAYGAWTRGEEWDGEKFTRIVEKFAPLNPLFTVVPDVIADKGATLRLWEKYSDSLKRLTPVAFVFCDGMTTDDIPHNADYVFVGGSTIFKEWAITQTQGIKQPVHVGRVNYHGRLWKCKNHGVDSCDGTGWFRGDKVQEQILLDYFSIMAGESRQEKNALFHIGRYC